MSLTERVKVGVGCLVTNEEGLVLLGVRKGSHGAGTLAFPGGKPDAGESPRDAALRELEEETGLVGTDAYPLGLWTYDRFEEDDLHYVTLYFVVTIPAGAQPELREPDKCEGWEFYNKYAEDADDHPIPNLPMFAGVEQVLEVAL